VNNPAAESPLPGDSPFCLQSRKTSRERLVDISAASPGMESPRPREGSIDFSFKAPSLGSQINSFFRGRAFV